MTTPGNPQATAEQPDAMSPPSREEAIQAARRKLAAGHLAYTIDEFAVRLGVSRRKIYDEIRAGKLKAKKLGSRTLITAPHAQAYLDTLPGMPPDA